MIVQNGTRDLRCAATIAAGDRHRTSVRIGLQPTIPLFSRQRNLRRVRACDEHQTRSCAANCSGIASGSPNARSLNFDSERAPDRRDSCGPRRDICTTFATAGHHGVAQTVDDPTATRGAALHVYVAHGPRSRLLHAAAHVGCTVPVTPAARALADRQLSWPTARQGKIPRGLFPVWDTLATSREGTRLRPFPEYPVPTTSSLPKACQIRH